MDRRQRKSREAIFKAFSELLSEKSFSHITVGEIIDRADVGRATFYAHFETKDYLLKELCEELFCHIFDSVEGKLNNHKHIFECDAPDSVFLHLFQHLKKNDNSILELLSCQNNEIFLRYFKDGLLKLIKSESFLFENENMKQLPEDFRINFISSAFVETVKWWIDNKMKYSPEEIAGYFMLVTNCKTQMF
ncbi:MAG: TetR/AcrR family transcriptional regulator [Clostridia bacterium]|nr:TetR/AcrR family transcriptional regulator [Clostridia bacterium]